MSEERSRPAPVNSAPVALRMAHFVIRTNRFEETVKWYETVLCAKIPFRNEGLAFLAFDEEHHRLAIVNNPNLKDSSDEIAAIDHVAFTYASLGDLLLTYERLKTSGIMPRYTFNHGMTTSFYYVDPNGNKIELQVDNFGTPQDATDFIQSPAFAANPVGVEFDPDALVKRWRAKEPLAELLKPAG
jgi:catechol-2,3-dioxygenase